MFALLLAALSVGLGWENGWVKEWRERVDGLEVRETRTAAIDGLEKVVVRWTWKGEKPLEKVTLAVREHVTGEPAVLKPFMPGVMMYGNPSNAGRTDGRVPVYAGKSGEFAIFEEHRFSMPFVMMENSRSGDFTAIHVLPSPAFGAAKVADLWWSAGVEATADGADIVLLSGPIGYNRRRSVAKAVQSKALAYDETYLTLQLGDIIEKTFWIQRGKGSKAKFGFEQAMSVSLDLFKPFDAERYPTMDEIVALKRKFTLSRLIDEPERGIYGVNMYDAKFRKEIVLGWAGACEAPGWALPVLAVERGDDQIAQKILDFISTSLKPTIAASNGLFKVRFDVKKGCPSSNYSRYSDPISCGQSLYNVMKAIRYARKHLDRLDPTKWEDFAFAAAENAANYYLSPNAKPFVNTGTAFFVPALIAGYELSGNERMKAAAEKLANEVAKRYFGYDAVYWGGTLDANCEDKEGCIAAFLAFQSLLKDALRRGNRADEQRWARLAEHSLMMSLSYTVVWDIPQPAGRLADHGFKSTGWTVVSAQNQHLDVFGVLITPEVKWMGRYLKDPRLEKLAEVMYRSCGQLVDANGSQGEQIQHTNFAQRGNMSDVTRMRGGYSEDWTVFWITAHFLNAAASFKEMGSEL